MAARSPEKKKNTRRKKAGSKVSRRKPPVRGRPRIEFDLIEVAKLGEIRAPLDIMAHRLGCHEDTIRERIRVDGPQYDEKFFQAYHQGIAERNIGLRTRQYQVAMDGDVKMLIHLGKHELGQGEALSLRLSNDQENPIGGTIIDYNKLTTTELKVLDKLLKKASEPEDQ